MFDGVQTLSLEFGNLDYISSAGLRVLLKLYKRETSEGKTVCIKSLSDFVRKILEETGYDTFLGIEDDTAEELHELAYEPVRYEEHERYMEYYRKCMTSCAETSFLTVWLESTVLKV